MLELRYFDLDDLPEDIFEPHRAVFAKLRVKFAKGEDS